MSKLPALIEKIESYPTSIMTKHRPELVGDNVWNTSALQTMDETQLRELLRLLENNTSKVN